MRADLLPMRLAYPRSELRRGLVAAVLAGEKTATSELLEDYEAEAEPIETCGEHRLLLGYDDEPVAVLEVTEARVVAAGELDAGFARDEGEGFESVEEWREAHERFFGRPLSPDTALVAVRFRVLERV